MLIGSWSGFVCTDYLDQIMIRTLLDDPDQILVKFWPIWMILISDQVSRSRCRENLDYKLIKFVLTPKWMILISHILPINISSRTSTGRWSLQPADGPVPGTNWRCCWCLAGQVSWFLQNAWCPRRGPPPTIEGPWRIASCTLSGSDPRKPNQK